MNSPNLSNTTPGEGTPGSGQTAHEAHRTLPLYETPPVTAIPNFDSEIVKQYLHKRAADCLHRAWFHHQADNQPEVDKALADYFNCRTQQQGIEQEGK